VPPLQHQNIGSFRNSSPLIQPIASTQQPNLLTASGLRYSLPNYTYSHSQGDGRYAPGKVELAAFLAQVGLVGGACARILADVADVDALSGLTVGQFESYNIGPAKQAEILAMLAARRHRKKEEEELAKRQRQQQMKASVLRPPPGLELARDGPGCRPIAVAGGSHQWQQELPFLSSTESSSVSGSSHQLSGMAANFPSSLRTRCDTGESLLSIEDTKPHTPCFANFPQSLNNQAQEDDSKIEADLQELGGQMVGSILDF